MVKAKISLFSKSCSKIGKGLESMYMWSMRAMHQATYTSKLKNQCKFKVVFLSFSRIADYNKKGLAIK